MLQQIQEHLVATLVAIGGVSAVLGWVANTLSTLGIAKRIPKASKLALWIHGINGIVDALDPIQEDEK